MTVVFLNVTFWLCDCAVQCNRKGANTCSLFSLTMVSWYINKFSAGSVQSLSLIAFGKKMVNSVNSIFTYTNSRSYKNLLLLAHQNLLSIWLGDRSVEELKWSIWWLVEVCNGQFVIHSNTDPLLFNTDCSLSDCKSPTEVTRSFLASVAKPWRW